jgi:hypothetical protein
MATLETRLLALEAARQRPSFGNWPNVVDDNTTDSELSEIQRTTGRPVWRESDPAWSEIFLG